MQLYEIAFLEFGIQDVLVQPAKPPIAQTVIIQRKPHRQPHQRGEGCEGKDASVAAPVRREPVMVLITRPVGEAVPPEKRGIKNDEEERQLPDPPMSLVDLFQSADQMFERLETGRRHEGRVREYRCSHASNFGGIHERVVIPVVEVPHRPGPERVGDHQRG